MGSNSSKDSSSSGGQLHVACADDANYDQVRAMADCSCYDVNERCGAAGLEPRIGYNKLYNEGATVTPLFVACNIGCPRVARLLVDSGARDELALYAVLAGYRGDTRDLYSWDKEKNEAKNAAHDRDHRARLEIANLLLERGLSDVTAGERNPPKWDRRKTPSGRSVLCHAVEFGSPEVVEKILAKGASAELCYRDNCPPLETAVLNLPNSREAQAIVRLLLRNGASAGRSALGYAEKNGRTEMAEAIRQHFGYDED